MSELILNHHQLQRKYLESQGSCSAKEVNIHQLEEILKWNEHTLKHFQSNIELYKNYNDEAKLNDVTSEKTKTNEDNLQTVLEYNKHICIVKDPKTNNGNQE